MSGEELQVDPNTQTYSFVSNGSGGLFGLSDRILTSLTSIPISGTYFLADSLHNMGLNIAQPARAQGIGFNMLTGLLNAWRTFRNVAYIVMTLVVLVIGVMMLFQQKLDSSIVVNLQKAIPKIILALILITFSYAIIGLLIDAMYLVMFFFNSLATSFMGGQSSANLINGTLPNLIGKTFEEIFGNFNGSFWPIMKDGVIDPFQNTFSGDLGILQSWGALGWIVKFIFHDLILGALKGVAGILLYIILSIVFFFMVFSIVWKIIKVLAKSFVSILLNTIFAPIILLVSAFPNSKQHIKWFKTIIANLAVFPMLFILFVLGDFIVFVTNGSSQNFPIFPYLRVATMGVAAAEGGGVGDVNALGNVLALCLFITIPEILEKVRSSLGGDSGFIGGLGGTAAKAIAGSFVAKGATKATKTGAGALYNIGRSKAIGQYRGRQEGKEAYQRKLNELTGRDNAEKQARNRKQKEIGKQFLNRLSADDRKNFSEEAYNRASQTHQNMADGVEKNEAIAKTAKKEYNKILTTQLNKEYQKQDNRIAISQAGKEAGEKALASATKEQLIEARQEQKDRRSIGTILNETQARTSKTTFPTAFLSAFKSKHPQFDDAAISKYGEALSFARRVISTPKGLANPADLRAANSWLALYGSLNGDSSKSGMLRWLSLQEDERPTVESIKSNAFFNQMKKDKK